MNPAFILACGIITLITCVFQPELHPVEQASMDRPFQVRGTIQGLPEKSEYGYRLTLSPVFLSQGDKKLSFNKKIVLNLPPESLSEKNYLLKTLFKGDTIEFRGKLERPSYNLIPGIRDRRVAAELEGKPFLIRLKSPLQIKKTTPPSILYYLPSKYLKKFINKVDKNPESTTSFLLRSLLLGLKTALPGELKEKVNRLGIAHLFVISGFHIGVLSGILLLLFKKKYNHISLLIIPSFIWGYIWIIGFPIPALRAAVLATFYLILLHFGIRGNLLNTLGIAAASLLIFNPAALYQAGFQLTYACLLAIIWLFIPLMGWINAPVMGFRAFRENRIITGRNPELSRLRWWRALYEAYFRHLPEYGLNLTFFLLKGLSWPLKVTGCTVCIQFFLFPVLVFYFNSFNFHSLLMNLFMVPFVSFSVAAGILLFLIFWMPGASILFSLYQLNGEIMMWIISTCDRIFPPVYFCHPPVYPLLVFYLFLLIMLVVNPGRGWIIPLLILVIYFSWSDRPDTENRQAGEFEISMLDVGQGDCFHLRFPGGSSALIDAGGTAFRDNETFIGKTLISRYLWHTGVRELEYILISHPDQDHIAGYPFLKRAFPLKKTYYFDFHQSYGNSGTTLAAGDSFVVEGVHHQVLWPRKDVGEETKLNDRSLVLLLTYGHFRILFTGDISEKIEKKLVKQYSLRGVKVLKAGHHGSSTSSSRIFLRKLEPETAFISVGRRNPFNHPSPRVMKRLEQAGISIFSTAEQGTVKITTNGMDWRIMPGFPVH